MNPTHIDTVINTIQHKWGQKVIQTARHTNHKREVLLTGFSDLDALITGIPQRDITQVTGKPTSGMTTLTYRLITQAQQQGQHVVFVDMGTSFDGGYATHCGVKLDELVLVEAHEEHLILDLLVEIVNSRLVGLLICNLLPLKSLELDWRKVLPLIRESNCSIVILTQPHIMNDLAGLRLHFIRQRWLEQDDDIIGCVSRVMIKRHRYGKIGESVMLSIPFEEGTIP